MTLSSRLRPISLAAVLTTALGGGSLPETWAAPLPPSDEQFVESLEERGAGRVDSRRLAKLFFSVAATLDGGRTNARLLQSVISDRDPAVATSRTTLANSYRAYEESVSRFKSEVSSLLDGPDSALRLYRTLTEGHRTCWQLDNYIRLVQSHGASTGEMISILASMESCHLFRRVAHRPRVQAVMLDALSARGDPTDEVRELREELRAMEELLEDLRRIDEEEPGTDR